MEDVMANTILKELREFRQENNEKWEENDKRWEQNERRWEENDRRWEQNDKRWEENEKRWEQNDKRWEQNDKRWEQNQMRWIETDKILEQMNERLTNVEDGREKDRKEIMDVLDTMQKTITGQFAEMKENYDTKIDAIYALQRVNQIEHKEFREFMNRHEHRLDFYNSRINKLEQWKDQMDLGAYTVV